MATKCKRCDWKIKDNEEVVCCPGCGAQYHKNCYELMLKCRVCEATTPLGEKVAEKHRKKNEEQQLLNEILFQEAERQRHEADVQRLNMELEQQKQAQERFHARIEHLKAMGKTGYYEYKVISIVDKKGSVDINRLVYELNDLGLDGWRLQCAYTNELGENSLSIGGFGVNATADQNILILERFVSIQ